MCGRALKQKIICKYEYSSTHNNQRVETIQVIINRVQINRMCIMCIMEYYSAIIRNEVLILVIKLIDCENMQNERNQFQNIT